MKRSIEVIVKPDGQVAIEALNFVGADCEKATAFLEQALGIAGERRKKPEYHKRASVKPRQQVGT
jgi:hypothetical protein